MAMSQRMQKIHENAMKAFDLSYSASWPIRAEAIRARQFCDIPGMQYDGWLGRQFENRPKIEVNKIARSVDRIYNEYRNNRITVDFRPETDSADDAVADLLDDMYRADEQDSGAQEAYDNAFQEGCKGGYGGWRLSTDYEDNEDEENERQCIQIIPVTDADSSLYFDADARRYDKADATRAWLIKGMTRDAYKAKWPRKGISSFSKPIGVIFDWFTPDQVYVAEYYEREDFKDTLYKFQGLAGEADIVKLRESDYDEDEDLANKIAELEMQGYQQVGVRKITRKRVHKYIMNGEDFIEDCGIIAGEHIPLIPYFGNRSVINGVERVWGQVQRGKDAQQLYNMQVSVLAETAALGSPNIPVFTPEQMVGHEDTWAYSNITRPPFLLVNSQRDQAGNPVPSGPVYVNTPPIISQATSALMEISNRDIQDVTGNQDQGQNLVANTSADAVGMIQNRLDMGVFGYMDSMAKSMRRCGEVWLSIRRAIETDRRKVRTLKRDGMQGSEEIMVPMVDEKTGANVLENDISSGKYKVVTDVGPSFTTRRDATNKALIDLIQKTPDPQTQALLAQAAMMNMDGEGLDDLRKYARKQLVQQGVIEPTDQEKEQMQQAAANAQPDPQSQFFLAEAEKSKGLAIKAQADAGKAAADTELSKAKTAETLAGIDASRLDSVMAAIAQLMQAQKQAVQASPQAPTPQDAQSVALPQQ